MILATESVIQKSENLTKSHYENFPVAPFFLPKKYREAISLIYAFARTADDIADEGNFSAELRLQKLDDLESELFLIEQQREAKTDFFRALTKIIREFKLPVYLFRQLLQAFRQDIILSRYRSFEQVLAYCEYSANPIGRLLLILTKNDNPRNFVLSDRICTALQLINFLQDIYPDIIDRNRLYLPIDLMSFYQVSEQDLLSKNQSVFTQNLIENVWNQTYKLLQSGRPLGKNLNGRFGFLIRLIIQSGNRVLHLLKHRAVFYERPILKRYDYLRIALAAV